MRCVADRQQPAIRVTQHSAFLDRVFEQSVAGFIGVAMPSVGIGEQAYPVITAGTTAEIVAKDAAKEESTAATIGVKSGQSGETASALQFPP